MVQINENYLKLKNRYLFSQIGEKTKSYQKSHPDKNIIRFGIGDATLPLTPAVISAFHKAVDEMSVVSTFKGYGPEQGYEFLRELISKHEFEKRGVNIFSDEVFISDGAKCDTGNILDLFGKNIIGITDPAYPVYVDTNVMAGNTGNLQENDQYEGLIYLQATEENGFCPEPPDRHVDIIYLCSPNNPTGVALSKTQLSAWVTYALNHHSIILFDAAYERYIQNQDIPHSIYEIPQAKKVAIEFRSFSKTAGFTGTRCAFTVIPKELTGRDSSGNETSIWNLWNRRHSTKFNGVSYTVQRAAAAIYTPEGSKEVNELIKYYRYNTELIKSVLKKKGFSFWGGIDSPYIWVKVPQQITSWEFFDYILNNLQIVVTPGIGFGKSGEGFFRITSFGQHEDTMEAIKRIENWEWSF
ncbi:MAG: LL-diaminopimelate aminotransferase [Promethearchaeota archaeon]|nr:MAG: LL-diaminopimelate aminotransferase [Candidatus Lokiarchaeota archaeon]